MSIREPDLEGWNRYDPKKIPEEKRRLILRTMSEHGVPMYYILTIINGKNGYCFTDFGTTFWRRFEKSGTHWAWLDELKVER
jgi:hypothetical protein